MDNAQTLDAQFVMILDELKKLGDGDNEQPPSIERYVQYELSELLDADTLMRECCRNMSKHLLVLPQEMRELFNQMYQFSGSFVEGAMFARFFQQNEEWKQIEIDIMCNLFTIPQEVSHLLEPVEDKPGFVRLPFCQELCPADFYTDYATDFQRSRENVPYSMEQMPKYVSPLVMKDFFNDVYANELEYNMRSFMRSVYNIKDRASKTETTLEVNVDYDSKITDDSFFHASWDLVPAVHLIFWPHQAATWITRHRLWPPLNTIQSIVDKGSHLVPRSSPGGDVHSEWRFSFSNPEAILAQLRSRDQQQAYYFFKIFFYRYLKCVESSKPEGKLLYSYIVKTIMLWACEELPPEDPIWANLENSVQMLLLKLLGSLETAFLPHYFIPEINLLERVGEDVRIKCAAVISRWQSNILMTAPFDMREKREYINTMCQGLSVGPKMLDILGINCMDFFLPKNR